MSRKDVAGLREQVEKLERRTRRRATPPVAVPISTFAPRPFEPRRPIGVVIGPCRGGFTASFLDANLSTSGETEAEALDNLKDLLLMAYEDFEQSDDSALGPAMLKQKSVLFDVIQRKP
ncbi:type II toxin-antitoxin system HicB family antitoxin [Paludisphaera mucosa]|uniref:HicB-like antitoxin of toxin-antitoxin system domain-containing protein n=1 Tax=Paludisphaera mucosa TaxID=3030827 RepID=A0ABT6FJP8_9BACT|nr:hypothetical protein [Paludisphaera mucosa]MDG3007775.1 hypothetical protein [Paludisphaera mucosa]